MIRGQVKLLEICLAPKWSSRLFCRKSYRLDDQTIRKQRVPKDNDETSESKQTPQIGEVETIAQNGRESAPSVKLKSLRQIKEDSRTEAPPNAESKPPQARKKSTARPSQIPPRLQGSQTPHDDLASFLKHATDTNKNESSTVYRGTLYEYTVADSLLVYNFDLLRKGRPQDRGIDLIGYWNLPGPSIRHPEILKVIVQCKLGAAQPAMIRELEGSYNGAPAGWNDRDVLSLLVTSKRGTPGVYEAMQLSSWPMGLMQISEDGKLRQFLWNEHATRVGLKGLGVAVKYAHEGKIENSAIALTWMGSVWQMRSKKGEV